MNIIRGVIASAILISVLSVSGCAYLGSPNSQLVIETKINQRFLMKGKAGIMAITLERRIAIVNFGTGRFCAEGPTEVAKELNRIKDVGASFKSPDTTNETLVAIIASNSRKFKTRLPFIQCINCSNVNNYFINI